MSPVLAPGASVVASAGAQRDVPFPLRAPAPRIAFRTVLLQEDPHPRGPSAEPPRLLATQPPPWAQNQARTSGSFLRGPPVFERPSSPPHRPNLDEEDAVDPLRRHHATFGPADLLSVLQSTVVPGPIGGTAPANSVASATRAASSLEDLLPTLVRRIAWAGDRQRGTVRVELGGGELAGGMLLVHAEDGHVRVHMDVPPGVDAARWQERIRDRLASRGVPTDSVEVT